jgi:hypothetical protein
VPVGRRRGAALPPPQPENEAASTIKQSSKLAFQRILDGKTAAISIENAKAHDRSLPRVCSDADEDPVVVTTTLNGEGVVLILTDEGETVHVAPRGAPLQEKEAVPV